MIRPATTLALALRPATTLALALRPATTLALALIAVGCGSSSTDDPAQGADPGQGVEDGAASGGDARASGGDAASRDGGAGGGGGGGGGDAAAAGDGSQTGCSGAVTLERVHGNGAMALTGNWSSAELAVRATACGKPLGGASVAWAVTLGTGLVSADANSGPGTTIQTTTDASGLATAIFRHPGPMLNGLQSNEPGAISATVGAAKVEFVATTFNSCMSSCGSGVFQPYVQLLQPESHDFGTVAPGGKLTAAVQIQVNNATGWDNGKPVANVGVRIVNRDDPTLPPAITCIAPDETALTDATGRATCDVRAGTTLGQQPLRVLVGGGLYWDTRVTIGTP